MGMKENNAMVNTTAIFTTYTIFISNLDFWSKLKFFTKLLNFCLKGKFTHFQYFDMLKFLRNLDEQRKPQVKSFIRFRDTAISFISGCENNDVISGKKTI